jgi:hypothetical protein
VTLDPSELVRTLDRYRERLHALPGVVGSGVGLRDCQPVVEIFIAEGAEPDLERLIGEIADFDFVLVPDSRPADAQSPQPLVEE